MALESNGKDIMKEKPQSTARTFHAPPQILDIDGFIKHQPVTILADTRSSNDLMTDKRKQVTLCGKGENEEKMISTQCLEKLAEISRTSAEPSRLLPTKLHDPLEHCRLRTELAEKYYSGTGLVEHYYSRTGLVKHCCSGTGLAEHYCSGSGLADHYRSGNWTG
ncbi:hypothetical protein B296_00012714 [Ensete ventricosum]|uniref:Uncharacterized protein n=1 Tax=Ensete ventricosum TaxID=4639 RepID=A0A426YH08_ENSVE|nr:hypothetical protein B296_00012714 [Ensete ventricosum]